MRNCIATAVYVSTYGAHLVGLFAFKTRRGGRRTIRYRWETIGGGCAVPFNVSFSRPDVALQAVEGNENVRNVEIMDRDNAAA